MSFIFPLPGSFIVSFVPARGLRAGTEQQALMYSFSGPRRTMGLATGLLRFAHRARFSFRDDPFGFCALLPDVDFV